MLRADSPPQVGRVAKPWAKGYVSYELSSCGNLATVFARSVASPCQLRLADCTKFVLAFHANPAYVRFIGSPILLFEIVNPLRLASR